MRHSLRKGLKLMTILPLKGIFYSDFEDFSNLTASNSDFKDSLIENPLINRDHPPLNKYKQSLPLLLLEILRGVLFTHEFYI